MKPLSLMDVLVPFVPAPKKLFWASDSGVKFHIETALSNDKAGQEFTSLCGVKGDYLHQRGASQNFMRCEKCLELSSVTSILDSLDQGNALQQGRSLRVGDEGGEAPAIASPLQKFTGERATDARRSDEASISIEKPELERRAYPAVSEMIAANPAHMLHASGGCLEGRPPSRAMTSSVILSLPVHPMGREGVSSGVDGHAVRTERRPSNLEARAGVGVFEASSGILSGYQGPSADSQILKSFSCVRRGIDGFISAVGWVVDRETAAAEVTA